MLISQPDTGEQALEIVETLVRSNAVALIIVDSVAALVPQAEIDGEMGDRHVGLQGSFNVSGIEKTYCNNQQIQLCPHLHQPNQNENRCYSLYEPPHNHRRSCFEILYLSPNRSKKGTQHKTGYLKRRYRKCGLGENRKK